MLFYRIGQSPLVSISGRVHYIRLQQQPICWYQWQVSLNWTLNSKEVSTSGNMQWYLCFFYFVQFISSSFILSNSMISRYLYPSSSRLSIPSPFGNCMLLQFILFPRFKVRSTHLTNQIPSLNPSCSFAQSQPDSPFQARFYFANSFKLPMKRRWLRRDPFFINS